MSHPVLGAFFDLDGTLIDREPLMGLAVSDTCAMAGLEFDASEIAHGVGRSWPDVHRALEIRERLGWELDEFLERVIAQSDALLAGGVKASALPGAVELVARLDDAGVTVVLVTGSTRREAHRAVDLLGVADRFAAIVAAEDYGPGKPAPDCYLEAASRVGLRGDNHCVAFEDSTVGVASALHAGMVVVATAAANAPAGHPAHQDLTAAHHTVADLSAVSDTMLADVLGLSE